MAGAILLAALVGAVVWALMRRRATRQDWSSAARQAEADGTALHDAAVGELIAAGTANRPERWSAIVEAGDVLAASLTQVEGLAPGDTERRAVTGAGQAVAELRSALSIAAGAPGDTPLDEVARDLLRERLEMLAAALRTLTASMPEP